MKQILSLMITCLLVACSAKQQQENMFLDNKEVIYQGNRFIHRYGDMVVLGEGIQKQISAYLGSINGGGESIRFLPEYKDGKVSAEIILINNKNKQRSIIMESGDIARFAIINKKGNVVEQEAELVLPNDWVCFIMLQNDKGVIAWNEKNGGQNYVFSDKEKLAPNEFLYKKIIIKEGRGHGAIKEIEEDK